MVVFWLLTPCSVLFSSEVSEERTAYDLRVTKSVHVDAKVIGSYLTGNFDGIGSYLTGKFDGIGSYLTGEFDGNGSYLTGKFDGIGSYLTGKFDGIGSYFTGKFDGIRPITAMDEEEVKVLIPSLRELS